MSSLTLDLLGKKVELDAEAKYYPLLDYWVKLERDKQNVIFGLTPTGNIKEGGYRSLEFVVEEGEEISRGDTIAVSVTAKVKYLEAMSSGKILALNKALAEDIKSLEQKKLSDCWLAIITTSNLEDLDSILVDVKEYIGKLNEFAQTSPPPGAKGGSPTCKSVYSSIKLQKES